MISQPLPSWLYSVHHDGSELYVSNLYPRLGEQVHLRLRVSPFAPVKKVFLRTFPDGEQAIAPLQPGTVEDGRKWWEATLSVNEPYVHYRFIVQAEDGLWHYNAAGPSFHDPLDAFDFRLLADYEPPAWVQESIFYQIFPDRFANGDPGNDPKPDEFEYRGYHPHCYPWGQQPPADQLMSFVFYGGDLPGIIQRLDYLQELGVNALYLTPVFSAYSNHKYDVVDYEHVDAHFGGDAALIALRQALSERNMRYILDIVPNHSGFMHPWFQAARKHPAAPEAEFYTFRNHPNDYLSWLGVQSLPKLNYQSLELRQRIYQAEGSVFRRWLQSPFSADGWRVDVANMLGRQGADQRGQEIARGIRQAVKETMPQAYLIGENFFDASAQCQGDQWDGIMNYMGFASPLWHWLRGYQQGAIGLDEKITSPIPYPSAALEAVWRERRATVPWAITMQQYNLLGSHDVSRIQSITHGNRALHRLAVAVLFTYPGVPGIYYGDEIGLEDLPGLAQRGCMVWDVEKHDRDLLEFYRRLIALRRSSPGLQRGGFQMLAVEDDLFAFQREIPSELWITIAQRSVQPRPAKPLYVGNAGIPDGKRFVEVFSGQEAVVSGGALFLPELSQGGTVWKVEE